MGRERMRAYLQTSNRGRNDGGNNRPMDMEKGITRGQPQCVSDSSASACAAAGRLRGTNNGNLNSTPLWSP